ncbi:MAG: hypothetical protein ACR2OZ_19385 [Verrucomicrobiales bacterium]
MNIRTRILLHFAAVLVALGLGLAARAWFMPPPNALSDKPVRPDSVQGNAAASSEAAPVFMRESEALADLPVQKASVLRDDLKATFKSKSPLREELRLQSLLAESIKSPHDLARAFELLDSAGDEYFRQQAAILIARQWAERDPVAVLTALPALKDRHVRQQAIAQVVGLWAAKDPQAALAYVKGKADLGVRSAALHAIFSELAKRDPVAALKRAREFQEPNFSHGLERSVFGEWLRKDADAALRFAFDESDPARRQQFTSAAVEILSYTEPEKAWTLYQSLPPEQRKDRGFPSRLFSAWLRKDPGSASEAVNGMPDSQQRRSLIRESGRHVAFTDEAKARALAEKFTGAERELFLAGMGEGFTSDGMMPKFSQAAEIALSLNDPSAQIELMRTIGSRWGRLDAPGASEWLTTLPQGSARDAAVGEFVRGVFATDPTAALTWAAAITDEGKRSRRLSELLPKWAEKDPAAATAWLEQTQELSHTDRASLREKIR